MPDILTDASTPALAAANKANMFGFFRYLGQSRQAELHSGPDLEWVLTGIPHPFMNNVLHRQVAADGLAQVVDRALSYFRARNVTHLSWWTETDTAPVALAERLLAHGLTHTQGGPGMVADLLSLNEKVTAPHNVKICAVGDRGELRAWVRAFVVGFALPESEISSFELFAGLGFDLPLRSYAGYAEGMPVATAQLFLGAGVAGIYCVSTVPEARGHGVGAAITLAALREARDLGYRFAVLQSSPMGVSVYQRLGFREVCRMSHFYVSGAG